MDREQRYQRRMETKSNDVGKYQWRQKPQKKIYLSSSESTTESEYEFSKRKDRRSESKPKTRHHNVRDISLCKRSKIVISSDSDESDEENLKPFLTRKPAKRSNKVYVTSSESDSEVVIGKRRSSQCRKKNPPRRYSPSDFEHQKPRMKISRIIVSSDDEEEENKIGFPKERKVSLKSESLIILKPIDNEKEEKLEKRRLSRKGRTRAIKKSLETDPIVDPSTISLFNLEILPNKPLKKQPTKEPEVTLTQSLTSNYYFLEELENERNELNYDALIDNDVTIFDYNYNGYEQEVPKMGKVEDGYIFNGYLTKEEENIFFSTYQIENIASPIDDSFLEFFNNDTATEKDLVSDIRISLEMTI